MQVERGRGAVEKLFTSEEQLYDQISHQRLVAFIESGKLAAREIKTSTNTFGEFLFVTTSTPRQRKDLITFYGLGYHEQRERWVTDVWQYYQTRAIGERLPVIPKGEAMRQILEREAYIQSILINEPQTDLARLLEVLVRMSDEDAEFCQLTEFDNEI